ALRIIFPRPEFFFRKIENAWHKIAVCSARRENFYVPEATTTPRSNSGVFARARFGGGATAVYSLGETMIGALWARAYLSTKNVAPLAWACFLAHSSKVGGRPASSRSASASGHPFSRMQRARISLVEDTNETDLQSVWPLRMC